ncbi:MAG: AI-2E family transporter, partial [Pirellulaceae bacterium]
DSSETKLRDGLVHRVFVATVVVVSVVAVAWGLGQVAQVLLAILAGVLFAILLIHLSELLSHYTGLGHGWAFSLVVLLLVAITGLGAYLMGARIAEQFWELADRLPKSVAQLQEQIGQYEWGAFLLTQINQMGSQASQGRELVRHATGYASATLGVIANVVVVAFIALYGAYDPSLYTRGIVQLVPADRRPRAEQVLESLDETLWHWLEGRFLAMAIVWVLTSLGLGLMGMPLALTLGFLAGLLNFIPNIGPIASMIPAALLAIPQGTTQVLYVVILYTAVQFLESYLITPHIQKRMVSLPPAVVISAQLLMGVLFGFMGLLLATPITAAGLVLVRMLYLEDMRGETS